MKPRTAKEKEVTRLAKRLRPLTEAQQRWINRYSCPAIAFIYQKATGLAWCSNCGQSFIDAPRVKKCPHCGAPITAHEYSPQRKVKKAKWYTTIITTCCGWQVSRHFIVEHYCRKGGIHGHPAYEAVQIWTNLKGEQVIMARTTRPMCGYYDAWNFQSELSIKQRKPYDYKYDIGSHASRVCRVLPILRRNGFNGDLHGIEPDKLFTALLKDNFAETLFKCGQYRLCAELCYGRRNLNHDAVMICVRHRYIVKDVDMWCDYIRMAEFCGYDIHNPHYACPANLKAAHDYVMKRKEQIVTMKAEKEYANAKRKFFGIVIKGKGIVIQPLRSVKEFKEEGKAMHHCVFSGGYYEKKDSLVLSARDEDDNRIETVEVSLKTMKVVQCHGKNNGNTKHHNLIVSLVNKNMGLIKKAI